MANAVLSLLETGREGIQFIEQGSLKERMEPVVDVLRALHTMAGEVRRYLGTDSLGVLQSAYRYAGNLEASIEKVLAEPALLEHIFPWEICPFFGELYRLLHLEYDVLEQPENQAAYRRQIMENLLACHTLSSVKTEYRASVVLVAFNKLEYTKLAVESLYKYTDFSRGDIELILLDNGSTDGTAEYFDSLPAAKVIHLKYNVFGTQVSAYVAAGEYWVGFSNDAVATPHWLEQLIRCMDENPRAFLAVPTCGELNIANDQGIAVPYENTFDAMPAMEEFAAAYNHSNPRLWEERSTLMPFVSIERGKWAWQFQSDALYTQLEFVDDDMSTSLRRAGFQQILAKDTFVHHFGGVTLGEGRARQANNSLQAMRQVYFAKWGVDAWESRALFPMVNEVWPWREPTDRDEVLFLEPRFGDNFLMLRNFYRRCGRVFPKSRALLWDERYREDAAALFDEVLTGTANMDWGSALGEYDIISTGVYLSELPFTHTIAFLKALYQRLKPGGMLMLPVLNDGCAAVLFEQLQYMGRPQKNVAAPAEPFRGLSLIELISGLKADRDLLHYQLHWVSFANDRVLAHQFLNTARELLGLDAAGESEYKARLEAKILFLGIFRSERV